MLDAGQGTIVQQVSEDPEVFGKAPVLFPRSGRGRSTRSRIVAK